jgi:hypothetical protein
MKRIALLLFGLTLTVGMIGCAEKKAEPAPAATTTPAETTPAAPAEEAPK